MRVAKHSRGRGGEWKKLKGINGESIRVGPSKQKGGKEAWAQSKLGIVKKKGRIRC